MKKGFIFLAAIVLLINMNSATSAEFTNAISKNQQLATNTNNFKSINELNGNFNSEIKFVFSDIDGTLLPFDTPNMPQSAIDGVKKLKKAGIPIILATGRSVDDGIKLSNILGLKTYVIGLQGAEIANPDGEIIYQDGISAKEAIKMIKALEKFNKKNKTGSKFFFCVDKNTYAFESFQPPFIGDEPIKINTISQLKKDFKVTKIAIYNENMKELQKVQSHLKILFPNYHIDISSRCYCDISSLSATKGNGIKKVAEILKVDLKNTAVFGDAENDISMFKLIKTNGGLAVAVGNAMPLVKENAEFVTTSVNDKGFENAVDKILINNARLKQAKKPCTICK